jgi:hypothetical protein
MTFWVGTLTDYVNHCRDDSSCRRRQPSSCSCKRMRCALDEPRVRVAQHVYRNARRMDSKAVSGGMGELFLGPRLSPPAPPSSRSMKRNRARLKAQATAQTVLLRWIPPVSQWEACGKCGRSVIRRRSNRVCVTRTDDLNGAVRLFE